MDGLLIVDKPSGPTSHDIVACVRRVLKERRIGHTGTLDPMATGVLPLVIGRATRLARFMPGTKTYDAVLRLGIETDTYDAQGHPVGATFAGPWPGSAQIDAALAPFRGTFLQQPPAFSAKKIAGTRSYELARQVRTDGRDGAAIGEVPSPLPTPVTVTTYGVELLDSAADTVRLRVRCSAGFYIRSLAHDLGAALGTGAHLVELRRIEAAGVGLADALAFATIQAEGGRKLAEAAIVPMERMLKELPAVALTEDGVAQVRFGRNLGPADATRGFVDAVTATLGQTVSSVRLFGPSGDLVAVAEAAEAPGLLHPAVVLM